MDAKYGLGSFSDERRFFQLWVESQKEPEIRPNPIVEVGRRVSRVEMNAKNGALDTRLPTPTPLFAFFTAKGRKKRLDKADAVIPVSYTHLTLPTIYSV